jgi:peptidoglycan/LPS O-acetylase OafA/YrhL
MVHEMVHLSWNWTAQQFELTLAGTSGKFIVLGLFAAALGAGMLLFHLVEEPARHWMRRMIDVKQPPVTEHVDPPTESPAARPAAPPDTNLQHIDGARTAKTRTARTG